MSESVRIEMLPLGKVVSVELGTRLQEILFGEGVEFPCGGRGRCKGCRVKVLKGDVPRNGEGILTEKELAEGWRLACQSSAERDLTIELAQWDAPILGDNSKFTFVPREGLGIAIDVGTTTIVAQLVDLKTAHVLAVRTGLNSQAKHGADIMSRIEFAGRLEGQSVLQRQIRQQIGGMIEELLERGGGRAAELRQVALVGNTVMHHLFSGIPVEPLAHHPFEPRDDGMQVFTPERLGWGIPGNDRVEVRFLPCLGSFVGSDLLAGLFATGLHEQEKPSALIDLGTNGEIVVGNRERLICASTAAGPAFEGARISMGMRAATGAISKVTVRDGGLECHVLGGGAARGVCGSGLVDAVAAGLELEWIRSSGRFAQGTSLPLAGPVVLSQGDVRELQLAKGAIAAGLRLLASQWGTAVEELAVVYLAGAFGNYVSRAGAKRIGLLEMPLEKVVPSGNTALLGAKLDLFWEPSNGGKYSELRKKVQHVPLNEDSKFQDAFVEAMGFPR